MSTLLIVLGALAVLSLAGLVAAALVDNTLVRSAFSTSTQAVAVAVFLLVAIRTRFRRWDVNLALAAVAAWAGADLYFSLAKLGDVDLAFPSPADIGYLLFYPLMIASIVSFVRLQRSGVIRTLLLDSLVAGLGAATVLSVILNQLIAYATGPGNISELASAAYPALDVVLIAGVIGIAASTTIEIGPRWGFLLAGLLVFATGDILFALFADARGYLPSTPLELTWSVGFLLLAIWVVGKSGTPQNRRERTGSPIPAVAAVAGIAVLVLGTQYPLPDICIVLAATTVALAVVPVLVRQAVLRRLVKTQQEMVAQLEELDRAKSEMMSTVNHELRTPLTSIRGYLELVLDGEGGEIPEEARKMLGVVDHNTVRLHALVNDMLLMSKLDAADTVTERVPIDLNQLLNRVVSSLRPFAETRGVDLLLEENDVSSVVLGDEIQLERAFTNVTHNALKFTPEHGSVGIELEQDAAAIVIRVIDTGMGIPEHDLPQLFGRFFRASNAQAGAVPGTGLGLAIVRSLVKAHDGEISVASSLGIGTTVRIELPTADSTAGSTVEA